MSVGSNLQEMENVVTKGAAAAEPMPKLTTGIPDGQSGSWEDLGGPTPDNYRADDDSAKLKEPTLATVSDVVTKGAKGADPMPKLANPVKEEEEVEGEVVAEEDVTEEEVIAEEEEEIQEVQEFLDESDIEEDVNALLSGEDLSEEFQEKARLIFESALKSRVLAIREEMEEKYSQALEQSLVEEVAAIKEDLTDRVDAYLEYVADEWFAENQLAVEQGLKTEMTESFLTGMKSLFEDHYVSIPEEKYDVLNSMVEKLDEMEDKLNEQIERNVSLKQRLAESVADVIFSEVCEGLALSQKEKLASLAENVEFDSEDTYREKLVTLRNSYFSTKTSAQVEVSEEVENITEDVSNASESVNPIMESYLSVLSRAAKK